MKNLILILSYSYIFLILFLTASATAQLSQQWVKRYNGTGNYYDHPNKIFVDESGNVYVTGNSEGQGSAEDYFTAKYSPSGVVLWESRYNGSGNSYDTPKGIAVDNLGNVYVTGSSSGVGTYGDFLTIKYNSSGVQQWINRYNGVYNGGDGANDILIDSIGNIYVTGSVQLSESITNFCTIKYNSDGVRLWLATYDNGYSNGSIGIGQDSLGNIYVAGRSKSSFGFDDIVTMKYSSTGARLWVGTYHVSNLYNTAVDFKVDRKGNSYITGSSDGNPNDSNSNCLTLKYNSIGELQWAATFADPNNWASWSNSVDVDQNGNVYMAGRSGASYLIVKYNSEGTRQWFARYNGGIRSSGAECIRVDHLGNTFVTGSCERASSMQDFITLKYSPTGGLLWEEGRYNGPSDSADYAKYLALDEQGNVYVTGSSMGNGTSHDFATIKYSQTTSVIQLSSLLPESFSLNQNYPNPFNPSTKIRFDISISSHIKIVVYDALGRVVAIPVNENLKAGEYEAEFDGSELSSGVYFYRIQAGEFVETKKMLLLK